MTLEVLWHDLECSGYDADLPLWRELAGEAGGPVLDVGAGTGRVSLDLAAHGIAVVALDAEAPLLEALERRAAGLPVETVLADARDFELGRRFPLVLVPMQTLQLLGGRLRPRRRSCAARSTTSSPAVCWPRAGRRHGLLRRGARDAAAARRLRGQPTCATPAT